MLDIADADRRRVIVTYARKSIL